MFAGIFFILTRLGEITFLIPIIGILSWFVHGFLRENLITPTYILILFITSVIAVFWALNGVFRYSNTKSSAGFVAFVDLCFVGAFIAGVYELRFLADANCNDWGPGSYYISLGPFGYYGVQTNGLVEPLNETCALLKTCFALGIIECLFFFFTAMMAMSLRNQMQEPAPPASSSTRRRRRSASRSNAV